MENKNQEEEEKNVQVLALDSEIIYVNQKEFIITTVLVNDQNIKHSNILNPNEKCNMFNIITNIGKTTINPMFSQVNKIMMIEKQITDELKSIKAKDFFNPKEKKNGEMINITATPDIAQNSSMCGNIARNILFILSPDENEVKNSILLNIDESYPNTTLLFRNNQILASKVILNLTLTNINAENLINNTFNDINQLNESDGIKYDLINKLNHKKLELMNQIKSYKEYSNEIEEEYKSFNERSINELNLDDTIKEFIEELILTLNSDPKNYLSINSLIDRRINSLELIDEKKSLIKIYINHLIKELLKDLINKNLINESELENENKEIIERLITEIEIITTEVQNNFNETDNKEELYILKNIINDIKLRLYQEINKKEYLELYMLPNDPEKNYFKIAIKIKNKNNESIIKKTNPILNNFSKNNNYNNEMNENIKKELRGLISDTLIYQNTVNKKENQIEILKEEIKIEKDSTNNQNRQNKTEKISTTIIFKNNNLQKTIPGCNYCVKIDKFPITYNSNLETQDNLETYKRKNEKIFKYRNKSRNAVLNETRDNTYLNIYSPLYSYSQEIMKRIDKSLKKIVPMPEVSFYGEDTIYPKIIINFDDKPPLIIHIIYHEDYISFGEIFIEDNEFKLKETGKIEYGLNKETLKEKINHNLINFIRNNIEEQGSRRETDNLIKSIKKFIDKIGKRDNNDKSLIRVQNPIKNRDFV